MMESATTAEMMGMNDRAELFRFDWSVELRRKRSGSMLYRICVYS